MVWYSYTPDGIHSESIGKQGSLSVCTVPKPYVIHLPIMTTRFCQTANTCTQYVHIWYMALLCIWCKSSVYVCAHTRVAGISLCDRMFPWHCWHIGGVLEVCVVM